MDRTLNVLGPFSKGTAGSDHDGGGGSIEQHVSGSQGVGVQAAPNEHEDGEEEGEGKEGAVAVVPAAAHPGRPLPPLV
ncbi:hypothetical protein [Streptomyces sp. NBC_01618]|uniref:hypothetical protein n=1 Tax=Streptomyces sp. NBC_01618 TaxID=2975900 RepID=UPI003863EC6F|nr:hypothetical protein OH735_15710 [Streptomyces sp. NBC_01618]